MLPLLLVYTWSRTAGKLFSSKQGEDGTKDGVKPTYETELHVHPRCDATILFKGDQTVVVSLERA